MIWYLAGLALILQICFWGLGLALLILPARHRRHWPFAVAAAGLGLQSATVWLAAHTSLPGTDGYAVFSLLIPVALLLAAWRRLGGAGLARTLAEARRWWALGLVMLFSLGLQTAPFVARSASLTSMALSSCDAADYAAGGRVFKEFSSVDRSGYMGVTEVLTTLSVDNFYDFWLRLNHFTPSALIALNATLLGREPYELTSLFGPVLLALNLPGVFWLARSVFRFGQWGGLAVTAIYGCSPILSYAICQVALGQLLAAPAVALLAWAGWQAYRASNSWRRMGGYAATLVLGDWLMLGSYNFFIVFAFVPLAAYVGVQTLLTQRWARAGRWFALVGAALLVATVLFPERVICIVERFSSFHHTPFGWRIPGFWPPGWYGAFRNVHLDASNSVISIALSVAALAMLGWVALRQSARRNLWGAACTLPIFAGYAILLAHDARYRDNSSYEAYKLFAVFYPGILLGLCLWLRPPAGVGIAFRGAAVALLVAMFAVNVTGAIHYRPALARTSLAVGIPLRELAAVERLPEVGSVNVCLPSNWDILWANAFLLHKPQYFPGTEYEARHGGPLKGAWDLREHFLEVSPSDANQIRECGDRFYLVNRRGPEFAELQLARDWYPVESGARETWCWSGGSPEILVINPQPGPLRGQMRFTARSAGKRHVAVELAGERLWSGSLDGSLQTFANIPVEFAAGANRLCFKTQEPPATAPTDSRALTMALYGLQVTLGPPRPSHIGKSAAKTPLVAYDKPD